jgi:hypothetical protein
MEKRDISREKQRTKCTFGNELEVHCGEDEGGDKEQKREFKY